MKISNRSLIAIRSFAIAAGATMATSFVGVYAVLIGASAVEMGWLQSSSNSINNLGQILWGRLSDRIGRRTPFLIGGSIILAVLWFMLPYSSNPVTLIEIYAVIALFSSMITVNLFSFIADNVTTARGKYLSIINILASIGTIISLIIMIFALNGNLSSIIRIPFTIAAASYIVSMAIAIRLREKKTATTMAGNLLNTLRRLKSNGFFYRYFMATNVQSIFWAMAWPMFPITIVSVMGFSLRIVAILTVASTASVLLIQYILGKIVDSIPRGPLIFLNKIMLSGIPVMYALVHSFSGFIFIEIYSGFAGAIQNVVLTSYLLDIVPAGHRAEYISILNGFNGAMYFIGALIGGYLLSYFLTLAQLETALLYAYLIVFAGRFGSSFLFRKLKEENPGSRTGSVFSILLHPKQPGAPSGGIIKPR
ncbi:MAG: MFS transporter [Ferroplasma sp.]